MSVPMSKRSLSSTEFYHTAIYLRKIITFYLLRDFGIKDKIRKTEFFIKAKEITDEDKKILEELAEKYNLSNPIIEQYPKWFLDDERQSIMEILRNLIVNITSANSIYPSTFAEFDLRRSFQDKAICNCENLLQEFQFILSVIPIDIKKYQETVEKIEFELSLLKGWRKSDNRLLKGIEKKYSQQVDSN